MNTLKGKQIMVWTFMGNTRMYQALRDYGDRISQIGLFSFKVRATGEIYESGVSIAEGSTMRTYIKKWPHIKWLLTVANDGTNSIFKALRENTGGAQDKFLSELVRIMEKYPWCNGVDIDLEKGDDYSTATKSTAMFRNIYNTVKNYNPAKLMNICLPGMDSINGSVGGENWCVYADLNAYCDTASIMSYGMAWAGSAPGPVSPRSWLEGIYDYAIKVIDPDKVPWALPHVYDYMEGRDAVSYEYPLLSGTYNRRHYLTAYGKEQKTEFENILVDRSADNPSSATGIISIENGVAVLGDEGSATYQFSVSSAGTYDVAVRICYPFWDKNGIYISLDRTTSHFTESRLWWPYWRTSFWTVLAKGIPLSAGTHTIKISVDVKGVQFYGFRVCGSFFEYPSAGKAVYTLAPRKFKDVDGNMAQPDKGFKLTLEMLRRKPDSALIWYEDFRDENPTMYTVEMRIRGNRVRVYSGASYTLRFTATVSGFSAAMQGTARITGRSAN